MRGRGNQNHVAPGFSTVAMVGADRHQSGELSLGAGVRLKRHRGEPGDPASACSSSSRNLPVAGRLLDRGNRCILENAGHVTGNISAAAFSFIVHEPSGIIDVSSPTSFRSRLRIYRIIFVSR